jgi:hypothetical protein
MNYLIHTKTVANKTEEVFKEIKPVTMGSIKTV